MTKQLQITLKGLAIWSVAMLFYFYECFLRVFPNTLSDNLLAGLNINAEQYSLIGSSFFVIYALMQVPVGYCVNRIGVKLSLIVASVAAAIGVIWFSFAHTLSTAVITRLLMGFGASFGYIAILSLALNWFPRKHFGFFTGLSQFLGSIGPILAGAPFALILHATDNNWRLLLFILGFLGLGITLLISLFVKNKPPSLTHIIHLELPTNLKHHLTPILKNTRTWLIVLYTALIYAPMPVLGTFWGILYLQARGFNKPKAALLISMIWIGYAIGSPLAGKLSDYTRRRLPSLRATALIGAISSTLLIFFPIHNPLILALLFLLIGLAATGQSIAVATMSETITSKLQTTMIGVTNMCLMLVGAIVPSISGAIIHTAEHTPVKGTVFYSPTDFMYGLSLMPILFFIALLVSLFGIKETYCRSQCEVVHLKPKKPDEPPPPPE